MSLRFDAAQLLAAVFLAALLFWLRSYLVAAISPFLLAFIIAGLIEPLVTLLESKKIPRSVATASVITLLTTLLIVGFAWLSVTLFSQFRDLVGLFPTHRGLILGQISQLMRQLQELTLELPGELNLNLTSSMLTLLSAAEEYSRSLLDTILGTLGWMPSLILFFIVTIIATYFLSKDKEILLRFMFSVAPRHWHNAIEIVHHRILGDLIGLIKAQLLLLALTTTISAAFLNYLGIRYWLLIAIIMGILDIIPILGPGLILFPWAAVSAVFGNYGMILRLLVLFLLIFGTRQFLQPKLLGEATGIHPLVMLISLYAGVVFVGFSGILVGPVLAIIGKSLWNAARRPQYVTPDK